MATGKISLVFSGGVALGAYQAGAYARLHEQAALRPHHIAGSSVGAVNGALILGGEPRASVERLRAFWDEAALDLGAGAGQWLGLDAPGPWRHASAWLAVAQARLFGRGGLFHPKLNPWAGDAPGLYDQSPTKRTLERLVDFERLNAGPARFTLVATDVESGEAVAFDTAKGDRIGPEHLLASCAFLPEFPPLEIGGRLLADGGLSANAPVEFALGGAGDGAQTCFVVDLFSAQGGRPRTLEHAAARRLDLLFGNQTRRALAHLEREHQLRRPKGKRNGAGAVNVLYMAYRAPAHEPGPEKTFDFSRAAISERWKAGELDMAEGLALLASGRREARGERGVALSLWP